MVNFRSGVLKLAFHITCSFAGASVFWVIPDQISYLRPTNPTSRFLKFFFLLRSWCQSLWLIMLGFNDTSILVGHFVSSPRDREKRDRRGSRGHKREGQGRKRKMNESEGTDEIKKKLSPSTLTCCKDSRPCPTVSLYQLDALMTQDTRHLCLTLPPHQPLWLQAQRHLGCS